MTTAGEAYAVIRARLEANKPAAITSLRWQNEDGGPLPDEPAPFAYTEFLTEPARIASFGGGRGANRYRNPALIEIFVFVPRGEGLAQAFTVAEEIAALFRSYRDSDISVFDATVFPGGDGAELKPPGLQSEVGNYFWAAVEISLFFDTIG